MVDVLIYGVIGEDVTAADVKAQLAEADGEEVVVRIDSPGGSVFQGFSIFDAIAAYKGPKRAVIESAAFSIASYIAMAPFDSVEITSNGYLMMHNPTKQMVGDDDQFEREAKNLRKLKDDMIAAYSSRTGIGVEEVAAMLKEETYLNAEEALLRGFVSRVADSPVRSRVLALNTEMPEGVYAALGRVNPGGPLTPEEDDAMSEKSEPVAATVADIKAAFPKASSDFVLNCIEKSMPMASVAAEYAETMQSQNESLHAELETLRGEISELKQQAEAAAAEAGEAQDAVARATGSDPIAQGGEVPAATATERWNSAVAKYVDSGMTNAKAVSLANKNNPGLRREMLSEVR